MVFIHNSVYSKDIENRVSFSELSENIETDISIVGGGYTGLSSAIELRERGYNVCLFEMNFLGFGCSGRNGGHLGQGWSGDFNKIEKNLPKKYHKLIWDTGIEAVETVRERVKKYQINCDIQMGYVHGAIHKKQLKALQEEEKEWIKYKYENLTFLENNLEVRKYVNTKEYIGGLYDKGSGHLHPMKYLQGLAKVASELGVKIYENTKIVKKINGLNNKLVTDKGHTIKTDITLLCGNAYIEEVSDSFMKSKLAKVTSSILATKPFSKKLREELFPKNVAVADCNTALNYYRFDNKSRLVFGGRASYTNINPKDVTPDLIYRITKVFPSLKNIDVEMVWSGYVGITVNRIPHFGRIDNKTYFVQGFSGHGVALTSIAGKIMAEAISQESERFEILSKINHMTFPGGPFRTPVLAIAMSWFKLKDWLKI